jgi:hypothetical protein
VDGKGRKIVPAALGDERARKGKGSITALVEGHGAK